MRKALGCLLMLASAMASFIVIGSVVVVGEFGAGTRIGAGLTLAIESQEGRSRARDIILLSDGDDPARDGEWRASVQRARSEGIAVHCVALGDSSEGHRIPAGSAWLTYEGKEVRTRREDAPLREIARVTGGELILAGTQMLNNFPWGNCWVERIDWRTASGW